MLEKTGNITDLREGFVNVTGALKDYDRVARLTEIKVPALFTCGQFADTDISPADLRAKTQNAWREHGT